MKETINKLQQLEQIRTIIYNLMYQGVYLPETLNQIEKEIIKHKAL